MSGKDTHTPVSNPDKLKLEDKVELMIRRACIAKLLLNFSQHYEVYFEGKPGEGRYEGKERNAPINETELKAYLGKQRIIGEKSLALIETLKHPETLTLDHARRLAILIDYIPNPHAISYDMMRRALTEDVEKVMRVSYPKAYEGYETWKEQLIAARKEIRISAGLDTADPWTLKIRDKDGNSKNVKILESRITNLDTDETFSLGDGGWKR